MTKLKLWLIRQSVNAGHDTYDSAIVAAETAEEARSYHPASGAVWDAARCGYLEPSGCTWYGDWAAPEHVEAEEIGAARKDLSAGVVLASFNAG